MTWKEVEIRGRSGPSPFPNTGRKNEFEKSLRNKYLKGRTFAAHWVESASVTAFSRMESWRKNCNKGNGRRRRPVARRLFARAPQDACKLEREELRVALEPG